MCGIAVLAAVPDLNCFENIDPDWVMAVGIPLISSWRVVLAFMIGHEFLMGSHPSLTSQIEQAKKEVREQVGQSFLKEVMRLEREGPDAGSFYLWLFLCSFLGLEDRTLGVETTG